jgi:hypothetical protein
MDNLNDIRDLNDIKDIWRSAKVDGLPTTDEIRAIIRRYRSQKLRKKAGFIALAALASVLMFSLLVSHRSKPLVTRIGDIIFLSSWLFLLISNMRSFRRAYRLKDHSNKAFLQYLERGQQGQIRYYKRTLVFFLAINSAGLLLYLYDMVHQSLALSVIGYGLTVLYLLFVWLFLRPWSFRRKQKKFDLLREKLDKISRQL